MDLKGPPELIQRAEVAIRPTKPSGGNGSKAAVALMDAALNKCHMHPFPPASKLQFLIGKQLDQISLGLWQFQFRFDEGNISVEGDLEHVDAAGNVRRHNKDDNRLEPLLVHHLLGQTVTGIVAEPFCLTVSFERGDLLRIFSDDGQFECGQIYDESGGLLAVF